MICGINVWKSESPRSVGNALWLRAAPTYLYDDQITDTDAETLDSDGGIKAPRGPPLTKRQQGYTVE